MDLSELIAGLPVRGGDGSGGVRICDITDDSRTVLPGSLFIARAGTKADGRKFIPDALRAGAAAVLTDNPESARGGGRAAVLVAEDVPAVAARIAERFYGSPSSKLALIGVTGTNGKTTTAHLVHQILNGAGVRCGLIGTVEIDDGRESAAATLTTPPATELSRTFAVMVENRCKAAVMEVSSHALEQARVAALAFDVGVFTNLTGDHLDYHGTMEAYGAAKSRLFRMLPETGCAIVNAEDVWAERMIEGTRARVVRCNVEDGGRGKGGTGEGTAGARILSMSMAGTDADMRGGWGKFRVRLPLIGRHNVMNALQAAAAAFAAGVEKAGIERRLARAAAPAGRLEPVTTLSHPFAVLVDYAHTDDALRKVLVALRPLVGSERSAGAAKGASGRLAVVFGCGGDRDRTKRARMGAAAVELADRVYVTSDNPRTERPGEIIDQVLVGVPGDERGKVRVDADRRCAIERAISEAKPGDILLIAGKGHETYQIVPDGRGGTETIHFDDREVAREALGIKVRPARRPRPEALA